MRRTLSTEKNYRVGKAMEKKKGQGKRGQSKSKTRGSVKVQGCIELFEEPLTTRISKQGK